jgi:hypothetical protein
MEDQVTLGQIRIRAGTGKGYMHFLHWVPEVVS